MAHMTLADQMWSVWEHLRKPWASYLKQAGLDLSKSTPKTLLADLERQVSVNRDLPGMQDFAPDGVCGIEPSDPARSLFYHVLASPLVTPRGIADSDYPTVEDLVVIENCIYAASRRSLDDLRAIAGGGPLAIAVFAYEYVPAGQTVHQMHADLCFSRTGVARVGNFKARYAAKARGYFPYSEDTRKVHVVPVRYGAFIAAKCHGSREFVTGFAKGDSKRQFWAPIHKLFQGPECLAGHNIDLAFQVVHRNEKIRKVHLALHRAGTATGWSAAQLTQPPFVIEDNLAKFDECTGLLTPVPHNPLIEPAKTRAGKFIGFPVPPNQNLGSTVWFKPASNGRSSPEFVHARHVIDTNDKGRERVANLLRKSMSANISRVVKSGHYRAVNFVDWTAEGFIKAKCDALSSKIRSNLPAYSILGQPDFFPLVKQQDLVEWWDQQAPPLKTLIWPDMGIRPSSLSSSRIPGNISLRETLRKTAFDGSDVTVTAIVGINRGRIATHSHAPSHHDIQREATLSYRASSLFEPGWDIAQDIEQEGNARNGIQFLANYGLGSPYAEDTLICAAFGAYWPGAVPDITRLFPIHDYPSSTPILDNEVEFDGIPLPRRNGSGGVYQFSTFGYPDYVELIWKGTLAYSTFADVDLKEYLARTQATARVFQRLRMTKPQDRAKLAFLSFRKANSSDYKKRPASWPSSMSGTYRVKVAKILRSKPNRSDPSVTDAQLQTPRILLACGARAVVIA